MKQFSNDDVDKVTNILSTVNSVKNAVAQNNEDPTNRVALGISLFIVLESFLCKNKEKKKLNKLNCRIVDT